MLLLKKHRTIYTLKSSWEQFDGIVNIYQSYFVQSKIFKKLPIYSIPQKYYPIYFEIIENNKTLMIIPLCKYFKKNKYCILGNFNGIQTYDFIYDKNISDEKTIEILSFFLDKMKGSEILFSNMPLSSKIFKAFSSMKCISNESTKQNVNIFIGNDYDSYFSALSKHTRQNVRTAYNRIKKDGKEFSVFFSLHKPIARSVLNQIIDLYCERHSTRYNVRSSKLKNFYLKYFDFSTICQQKSRDNIYAILYIDGKIAAFLSGLLDINTNSAIIPRLSIDEDFYKYSPGVILINEVAKRFAEIKELNNLDLSKGNEKYKISMGGEIYESKDFII